MKNVKINKLFEKIVNVLISRINNFTGKQKRKSVSNVLYTFDSNNIFCK